MATPKFQPDEIILEVLRDADGNCYCVEVQSQQIVYQSEVVITEHKMLIHRGDKGGPVIATADLSQAKEGISVVEFHEPQSTVQLTHVHHRLPLTHANTYFTFCGKKYHWKAHAALVEDDTRICLAAHHTINLGGPRHRLGSIVLTNEGLKMRDLVAVTLLVEQARSDEAKLEKMEKSSKKP